MSTDKKKASRSKTVHRCFERYSSGDRANMQASHRLGYLQRQRVGEFYYVSDLIPNIAFPTRSRAEAAETELTSKAEQAA
jgi:hypothetical protein